MTATVVEVKGIRRGPVGLPKRTLGWQVLGWTAEYLLQPDGPQAGEPWRFTDEQARFVLWWYALDKAGRFVYPRGMLRRMKGWGKDPVAAALCCVECLGPCRFGGWSVGQKETPYAQEHAAAWVQVAAVSRDQTRNTMTLFPGMLSKRASEEHEVDLGKEIIYAHRGARRIEAVTSSPRALEGGRSTFTVKNETHHWIRANEGLEMAAVIARNAAKSRDGSSRVLAISNAHALGEDSDAERDWQAFAKEPAGMLFDSLEGPEVEDLGDEAAVRSALEWCRGDSEWLDVKRLLAEIQAPQTGANVARRYYLNQVSASDEKAFDRERWEQGAKPEYRIADGSLVVLGFDGSRSRDATGLVVTEVATGHQQVVGLWENRDRLEGWEVPEAEVDSAVAEAFRRWEVWRAYCDPYWWESYVAKWAGEFGEKKVVRYPTNALKRMAYALKAFAGAIEQGELTHTGDADLARHIGNAYKNVTGFFDDQGERMWVIQKNRPDSWDKIDLAMAACWSWQARVDAVASGAQVEHGGIVAYFPKKPAPPEEPA